MSMSMASVNFTAYDQQHGYQQTRKELASAEPGELAREYIAMLRASFDRTFGHNARSFGNLIAQELLSRGITEIPNIFGAIEVKEWHRY